MKIEPSQLDWPGLIREYRGSLGLTVRKFASRFDVSTQTVYSWESGVRQAPYKVTEEVMRWMVEAHHA